METKIRELLPVGVSHCLFLSLTIAQPSSGPPTPNSPAATFINSQYIGSAVAISIAIANTIPTAPAESIPMLEYSSL